MNTSAVATEPAACLRGRFTLGEWMLLGVVALAFLHHIDQYGTWANRISSVPRALGQPNLLDTTSPVLGALSVAVSSLPSVAVLAALVLLARDARANQLQPAGGER